MAKAEYRSAIRSRKLINNALADLLLEKPLDKITITDVVRKAEINRGTFYAHYTDIPDVINHLIQQTFSRIQDVLSEKSLQLSEVPPVLLQQIQTLLEEDLDFYQKVMRSNASGFMQEQLVSIVQDYLIQHEADFSPGTHAQYILTVHFCASGLIGLYRDWFAENLPFTLDELTNRATKMVQSIITEL